MNGELFQDYLSRGKQFAEAGEFTEAIACYQKAKEQQPDFAETYQRLAEVYVLTGQLEEAIAAIEVAINLKPDFGSAYLTIGNALQQQNQMVLAIWAYTQALDIQPNLGEAQANLGSLYYYQGRFLEAIQCYEEAIQSRPSLGVIYWMLGNALTQVGQLQKAIYAYQNAIKRQPDWVQSYLKLAQVWLKLDNESEAIACYQTLLEYQPEHPEATQEFERLRSENFEQNLASLSFIPEERTGFEERGVDLASPTLDEATKRPELVGAETEELFVKNAQPRVESGNIEPELQTLREQAEQSLSQGQFEEAIALCHQILKIQPNFLSAYVTLGNTLQFQGKIEAAIRAYSQALEIQPNFAEVHANLGTMYIKLGQIESALSQYQKAVQLQPNLAAAHWNLGKVLQRLGRTEEAIAAWQKALELQPDLGEAKFHFELGNALAKQAKFEQAIQSYQRAITLKPNWAEVYGNLGGVQTEQGNYAAAIQSFQKAIELKPDSPELYLHSGYTYVKLGQYNQARSQYQRLIQLQPDSAEAYSNLGSVYCSLGQIEPAVENYQTALQLRPDWSEVYCRLAHIQKQDNPEAAVTNLEKAIELKPDYIEAYQQLCDLLSHSTRLAKARKFADQYCQNCGEVVPILSAIAYVFAYTQSGECEAALTKLQALEKICTAEIANFTPFEINLLYEILLFTVSHLRDDLAANSQFYQLISQHYYHQRQDPPLTTAVPRPSSASNSLRIGFMSKHFRRHSVGWCSEAVIQEFSKLTPNVHLYVSGRLQPDELTQRFEQMAAKFYWPKSYPNGFASATELAEEMIQDQLDVLVDLDSITVPVNVQILNYSPASVCVSWLGFDAPYLSLHHYFLCDEFTHPAGRQDYYMEQLVYLPQTAVAIAGFPRCQVDRNLVRKQLGIQPEQLAYLCVAPGRKTNLEMVKAQVKILQATPGSVLIRKGQGDHQVIRQMYGQACEEEGVEFSRILFIGLTKTEEEHRAIYDVADVLLDSYPYNGGTHNLEALWANLPIITRAGEQYLSRMGYSFLKAVNLDIGVAWSWEEYTALGIQFGRDQNLRQQIRHHLIKSKQYDNLAPLWNAQKLAQQMYRVFEELLGRGNSD